MDDREVIGQISAYVAEERALRERAVDGEPLGDEELLRLRQVGEHLDQCWDLLRQRRAHAEFGENPDAATPRPVSEVESYLQ